MLQTSPDRLSRFALMSAVVAVLCGSFLVQSPAVADDGTVDELRRASELGEELGLLGDAPCDACAYVVMSDDQTRMAIQVKGGVDALTGPARDLYEDNRDIIDIEEVEHSYLELRDIFDQVEDAYLGEQGFQQVSIDPYRNEVELVFNRASSGAIFRSAEGGEIPSSEEVKRVLSFDSDAPVRVDVVSGKGVEFAAGRYDDYPRYWMGGKIKKDYQDVVCSLGIPVRVAGRSGVLTAAHCGRGSYKNGSQKTRVGQTYKSSYDFGARAYGDWQILVGSTYANRVFTGMGGSSSTTSLPISGVYTGKLPINRQLCASGHVTGQTCRYYVAKSDVSTAVSGYETGSLTLAEHRGDRSWGDCEGFSQGDSGGLAYYSDNHGGVIGYGLVTALNAHWSHCSYYFTRLEGVRRALPDVVFKSVD